MSLGRTINLACLITAFGLTGALSAQEPKIDVAPGFAADRVMDQYIVPELFGRGDPPRLDAVANQEYAEGVAAAVVYIDTLIVYVISDRGIHPIARYEGFSEPSRIRTIRFDRTGIFGNLLYLTVVESIENATHILQIDPAGNIKKAATRHTVELAFDFTNGETGFLPGAYMHDIRSGRKRFPPALWRMARDEDQFVTAVIARISSPPARRRIKVRGMRFDTTGEYGSHLIMADCDDWADKSCGIYKMTPDLEWEELSPAVSSEARCYADIALSLGGSFGQRLYVTDALNTTFAHVAPDGDHKVVASGFDQAHGIAVTEDGEQLYVSDRNGVYVIRRAASPEGSMVDCNNNAIRDSWDLYEETSFDCNNNGIPDECDLASGTSEDCNDNGMPDVCELTGPNQRDCDGNTIPDDCDIKAGRAEDKNGNGWPDHCEPQLARSAGKRKFDLAWQILTLGAGGVIFLLWLTQRRKSPANPAPATPARADVAKTSEDSAPSSDSADSDGKAEKS